MEKYLEPEVLASLVMSFASLLGMVVVVIKLFWTTPSEKRKNEKNGIKSEAEAIKLFSEAATQTAQRSIELGEKVNELEETVSNLEESIKGLKERITTVYQEAERYKEWADRLVKQLQSHKIVPVKIKKVVSLQPGQFQ